MEVKHFIACVDTLPILPKDLQRTLLHDVRYTFQIEQGENTIFIDKICLFSRFYGAVGSYRFRLEVVWENADEKRRLKSKASPPLEFDPTRFVHDYIFAMYEIRIPGPGLLTFELTRLDEPEIILAVEYLEVRST